LLTKIFFFFSLEWNKDEEVSSYKTIERSKWCDIITDTMVCVLA
jgi:hypothetical protein